MVLPYHIWAVSLSGLISFSFKNHVSYAWRSQSALLWLGILFLIGEFWYSAFWWFFLKEKNSLGPEVNQTRTIFNIWLNLFWLQSNEIFVCQIEWEKWEENTWRPNVDYLRKKPKTSKLILFCHQFSTAFCKYLNSIITSYLKKVTFIYKTLIKRYSLACVWLCIRAHHKLIWVISFSV